MLQQTHVGRVLEVGLDGYGRIFDDSRRGYAFHIDQISLADGHSCEEEIEGRRVEFALSPSGRVERVWLEADAVRAAASSNRH